MKPTKAYMRRATRAMAEGWVDVYRNPGRGGRERDAERVALMFGENPAYLLALACDPEWDRWAITQAGCLVDAAANARDARTRGVPGHPARRDMLFAADDILMCRTRGSGHRTPGSRRAAVRLIAALCTDPSRRPALGAFLWVACPDVHDEAGITLTRQDLLPALTHPDPDARELAMRVAASLEG